MEFTTTSVSFLSEGASKQKQLVNQTFHVFFFFFFPPSALRYSGHPLLAVVSDSLWEKDGGLRWHLGKAHNHVQAPLLMRMKPVRLTGIK